MSGGRTAPGAADQLADMVDLQVRQRARQVPGRLVDGADVVGEQHRCLHHGEHPPVVDRRARRVRPERPAPSGSYSMRFCGGSSIGSPSRGTASARAAARVERGEEALPIADAPLVAEMGAEGVEERPDGLVTGRLWSRRSTTAGGSGPARGGSGTAQALTTR
jgi:hypothetical protein